MHRSVTRRTLVAVILGVAMLVALTTPALAEPDAYSSQIGENCQLLRVDAATGAVAEVGGPGPDCATFLARSPADDLYGVSGSPDLVLSRVDKTTGALTTIGPLGVSVSGAQFVALTFDPAGHLWATVNSAAADCSTAGSTCLYSVDPTSGAATLVGGGDIGPIGGLAADCTGVYAATYVQGSLFRVDTTTGAFTEIGPTGVTPAVQGMAFAPDGTLWALGAIVAEAPYHVWTIDTATGAGTQGAELTGYAQNPFDQAGLAMALPSCPPATPSAPGLVPVPATPVPVLPAFTG